MGEIWREENKQNLQIRHVAALTTRVNQGVEPWVSQRPLASVFPKQARAETLLAPDTPVTVPISASTLTVWKVYLSSNTVEAKPVLDWAQ